MLDIGVIEESHSEWSSPVFLVLNIKRSVSLCVDFIKGNAVPFDRYVMTCADELLNWLGSFIRHWI